MYTLKRKAVQGWRLSINGSLMKMRRNNRVQYCRIENKQGIELVSCDNTGTAVNTLTNKIHGALMEALISNIHVVVSRVENEHNAE